MLQRHGQKELDDCTSIYWWTFSADLPEEEVLYWFDKNEMGFYEYSSGPGRPYQTISLYKKGSRWMAQIIYGMDI